MRCQACGVVAPTQKVLFVQHVGAIVMFFHKRIGGLFCRDCVDKYFKQYTLTTLLFGWWGVISVFATPVVLLINFCNLFRARSLESVGRRSKSGARASFALVLPLLALAVYVVVYASGLWTLGQTQLAPRVFYGLTAHVTLAALVGFALSGFAGVRPLSALVGTASLFALSSVIGIGQSTISQHLIEMTLLGSRSIVSISLALFASVLIAASIMIVASAAVPALRRRTYWLIALLLWPAVGYLSYSMMPVIAYNLKLGASALTGVYFAVYVFKQVIVFACLGYWLHDAGTESS
jgi:hypothetical protein